jgi:hypothetical protein
MSGGGSSDGDKLYKEFSYMTPEKVNESAAQSKFSVCHVQAPPISPDTIGLQGSATLYELAEGVFTIATNNHVIPITDVDFLVNIVFTFEGLGQIRLSKKEIKYCTTNKELDATVIELTEECVKRFQQFGAKFIRVTNANGGVEIAQAQYAEGEFSVDKGNLIRLLAIAVFHIAISRYELTRQWQQRQESLEKRICDLQGLLEKGKKSNSSQRNAHNADKEEIISDKNVRNQNLNPSFTICQVKYKEQTANGAIYDCEYPKGTFRTLFITSYLEISNVNEITDVCLVFEGKTIGNQYLTPDWVKWLWTSPVDKFNVTVIEFSPTALKVLSRTKYELLTSDVPVDNKEVSVFQYIKENLNFSKGRINKVIGEVIEYSLNTKELSWGFPLLNEQLKVVGIHTNKLEGGTLKAIAIGSILEAFKTFITEKLGGRTENE